MATTDSERTFAFGGNSYEGCYCPAIMAGFNPDSDDTLWVAEMYDEILAAELSLANGTVDEETAKEAWLDAIDRLERADTTDEEALEAARKVAERLGWD